MGAISFPNLGIVMNPSRIAFSVLGKDIYWYGIIIALGFILAVVYGMRRAPSFGLTEDNILDMLFAAVPSAIVGARLYYVVFYWELFADHPISALYIWEGGMAIYGAVIGALLAAVIFCKVKKVPIGPIVDIGGLGLMIGQMIGRWGNFMNREAHGAVTDSFLKMGLENGFGEVTYYHPTFLYESIWNLVGFIALHFFSKKRKCDGEVFAGYVAWYGLGRLWIEGLRTDSLYLFGTGIRVSQLVAGISCVVGIAWILYSRLVKKSDGSSLYVRTLNVSEEEKLES